MSAMCACEEKGSRKKNTASTSPATTIAPICWSPPSGPLAVEPMGSRPTSRGIAHVVPVPVSWKSRSISWCTVTNCRIIFFMLSWAIKAIVGVVRLSSMSAACCISIASASCATGIASCSAMLCITEARRPFEPVAGTLIITSTSWAPGPQAAACGHCCCCWRCNPSCWQEGEGNTWIHLATLGYLLLLLTLQPILLAKLAPRTPVPMA
mmetsp:Transcript_75804/g.195330  ORF Transcript_75804/g.195330 Transcript_75804/m.195330 type:complete len:209 (-) Transcript_75804:14-640(-)